MDETTARGSVCGGSTLAESPDPGDTQALQFERGATIERYTVLDRIGAEHVIVGEDVGVAAGQADDILARRAQLAAALHHHRRRGRGRLQQALLLPPKWSSSETELINWRQTTLVF